MLWQRFATAGAGYALLMAAAGAFDLGYAPTARGWLVAGLLLGLLLRLLATPRAPATDAAALAAGAGAIWLLTFETPLAPLLVGAVWWLWWRRLWAGAGVLAACATLLWLRELTAWPDAMAEQLLAASAAAGLGSTAFGPSALALPAGSVALLLVVAAPRRAWRLAGAAGVMAILVAHWLRLASVADGDGGRHVLEYGEQTTLALTAAVACAAAAPAAPRVAPLPRAGLLAAVAAAVLATVPLLTWSLAAGATAPRVVFLNEGGLDWHRPHRGTTIGADSGMFGNLPVLLRRDGFAVAAIAPRRVSDDDLARADVLVSINDPRLWTKPERAAVRRFVERGGALLVLGDHTDVFGLRRGFNSLLADYGIAFRFDAAYHSHGSWRGCLTPAVHPALVRGEGSLVAGHGIGASLACEPGVETLLWGRRAFSDHGVRDNHIGAFLGNYHYHRGERYGDLVLAAWRPVGAGRVVVYGDTSAFQNGGLPYGYRSHVLPLFRWLTTTPQLAESALYRLGLLLLAAAGVALAVRRSRWPIGPMLALATLGTAATAELVAPPWRAELDGAVLIDRSTLPLTGHYDTKVNEIGPLYTNLARSGLLALRTSDPCRDLRRSRPAGVVLVAPGRRLDDREVATLLHFMEGGGHVVLATGIDTRAAAAPLLQRLGLDVEALPLGRVPSERETGPEQLAPRTRNAWPLSVRAGERGEVEDLFAYGDHRIAVLRRVGRGGLIAIGDGTFFSDTNVEDMWSAWPGNIRFLDHLFARYLGGDSLHVEELFASPEKPR